MDAESINTWAGLGLLVAISLLAHEPWRWLGVYLGRRVSVAGELFQWIKAVSTALVAALVMRLMLFPPEGLGEISLLSRMLGISAGVVVFWMAGRHVAWGVAGGAIALFLASAVLG
ncbi:MAG: AzlD domain-containing protein [Hyphomicrobiaceae bacterium]